MITAQDAVDTLLLLVPGFLALKIFYVFGLKTKRSDLEWTIWSLLVAALINALIDWLVAAFPLTASIPRSLFGIALAVAFGIALVIGWQLISRSAAIRQGASHRAWDAILSEPSWVQVWTKDGRVVSGQVALIADPVETDDLDLYLVQPAWVDMENDKVIEMTGVAGFLIEADDISFIQVMSPVPATPSPA